MSPLDTGARTVVVEEPLPARSSNNAVGVPRATARLQFHKDFTFAAATALVPYFASLGVSHVYASPILKARPGSTHGYDCIDATLVNPELGGEEALRRLADAIHAAGMGLVVDIVPNHMGIAGADNPWWRDVLLWGEDSRQGYTFDIDWASADPTLRGKLLAPFLGAGYGEVLASGDLALAFDDDKSEIEVRYFVHRFPISIAGCIEILSGSHHAGLRDTAESLAAVERERTLPRNDPAERERQLDRRDALLATARLAWRAALESEGGRAALDASLARYDPKNREGRARLHHLLERQAYRLASWRVAADEINWRRFFEVTDLAGVRVERPEVFEQMHATLFRLYREGIIDAMRVDHVDGLADPRAYCRELRRRLEGLARERVAADPGIAARSWNRPWIVVEKILASSEDLRRDWRVDGTSGYDFMDEVGALLHDADGAEALAAFWARATGRPAHFRAEALAARRQILAENLPAEFGAASRALHRVARAHVDTRDIALVAIQRAFTELLVQIDVYRTYVDGRGRDEEDTAVLVRALRAARDTVRPSDRTVLSWLDHWLGGDATDDPQPESLTVEPSRRQRNERRIAITRFQQLTPPLAAKSVEDTAFYRYGRLISRNEVGSDPDDFALPIEAFHAKCLRRAKAFPHAMLAIATHDHKRGADTRARLAVLSEIAPRWIATLERWTVLNTPVDGIRPVDQEATDDHTTTPAGRAALTHAAAESAELPLPEDALMLVQSLIGSWPLELAGELDFDSSSVKAGIAAFIERIAAWQVKALRETKRPSDWAMPNESYEATCRAFLDRIMDPAAGPFVREAAAFVAAVGPAAAVNGLVQSTLHLTVPGVPDLYQGTDRWDFSLVDPDNRRPVDYAARQAAAREFDASFDPSTLLEEWRDGRIKQALITRILAFRRDKPALFARGSYQPLEVQGDQAGHVLAFLRRDGDDRAIVVVTIHAAGLVDEVEPLIPPERWGDTALVMPAGARGWLDVVTDRRWVSSGRRLKIGDLLAMLPVAVLRKD